MESKTKNNKQMKYSKNKLIDAESLSEVTRGQGIGNYMVMDGNQTCDGDHSVVYTDAAL